MALLLISFTGRMEKAASNKDEYYRESLQEQFDALKKHYPLGRRSISFEDFIETCFPSGFSKNYFFSCPNFLREKHDIGNGTFLNNVVIRPEITLPMRAILPAGMNVILIGDIRENGKDDNLNKFQAKGIQFIEDGISSKNDMRIVCDACNAFRITSFNNRMGQTIYVDDWRVTNWKMQEKVLTPDFIARLIRECFTVTNPIEVRETYNKWKKYIEFRNYYLEAQADRNFHLDKAVYLDSYAVNRREYRLNKSVYDENLLDGQEQFSQGEMVVLSSNVPGSESFPLIRIDIDRNKKEFEAAKVLKNGKLVSEEKRKIRSLAGDNVFITKGDPATLSDKKFFNKNFRALLSSGFVLGDRFRTISFDIEPTEHIDELSRRCDQDITEAFSFIEERYEARIRSELDELTRNEESFLRETTEKEVEEERKRLEGLLDQDVLENKDNWVLSEIKKEKGRIREANKKGKDEKESDYQDGLKELYLSIDVRSLYLRRNEDAIEAFAKRKETETKRQLDQYRSSKYKELQAKYREDIRLEKEAKRDELKAKLDADIAKMKEEETVKRFSIYFRLPDSSREIKEKDKETISECRYIVYDSRAERAKIKRQEKALENFYSGYVKNPYLSTYLFNPTDLVAEQKEPDADWRWFLESLNEKQKEAVRKAVYCNGIFLLQGPPGTGKTQVIAETVAQMVRKGKKVLVSSETHKAIDNVFDRLPKTAEIVPVRLIPSNNEKRKGNDYEPQYLVDNFYLGISDSMKKSIARYENFSRNKQEFSESFASLKLLKAKIDKGQAAYEKAKKDIEALGVKAKRLNSEKSKERDAQDELKGYLDTLRRTRRHIEKNSLKLDKDIDQRILSEYISALKSRMDVRSFASMDLGAVLSAIEPITDLQIKEDLSLIDYSGSKAETEAKKQEIRAEMASCRDEFEEIIPGKEERYKELQSELRNLVNGSKDQQKLDLRITAIFPLSYVMEEKEKVHDEIFSLKDIISETKSSFFEDKLDPEIEKASSAIDEKQKTIDEISGQIRDINDQVSEIQESQDYSEVQENTAKLESSILKFFRDFEIAEPYTTIDEALEVISDTWRSMERNQQRWEAENKAKIPMYQKISEYLSSPDVIEQDRRQYTKDLFESANVFGLTCTSNDRFNGNSIGALGEYNIDDVDIKNVGIDVVIIDEVSKSSFIDLLIPILYGKTVILVGDHRQLPPMYDLSKLRESDFEGLDPNIINADINRQFTDLYEECFFKTLFEKIPSDYKTMLVQQYRCHEDIMEVFNHFYSGELRMGFDGQNNLKKHNIQVYSNGRSIISPDKHVYFVDCREKETHERDSTSMYNKGEAKVIVTLISKMNDFFLKHPNHEKLSIGVICTYGDQARFIKNLMKSEKIKTNAFKTDAEKMIVSTVDDFQGDERDIILLSTVRNPENPNRSNPCFILAYQRINVSLSRARRLLIVVGNRKYLEDKGVIDLPDVNGNHRKDKKNFHVYEKIIDTIETKGRVIDDIDVIEDKEGRING